MLRVFTRVAQRGSFAAAAEDLRMSRAAVTRHVAAIEERLRVRLLDRTTRSVSVTEAGRVYLEHCLGCLQAHEDSEAAMSGLSAQPKGLLRVAAPFDLNRYMPPLIVRFMAAHPAIDIDLRLSNRTLDMVDEGIDVYVRITNSLGPDVVARPLAITRLAVWGTRSYFREHGRPRTPSDLARHRFALFNEPPLLDEWVFERRGRRTKVRLKPGIVANSGEALAAAVSGGLVIGIIPSFLLPHDATKTLEPVLPKWSIAHRGVFAVYPHRRFVPAKVRAFVDFLRTALGDGSSDPWWPAGRAPHRAQDRVRSDPTR